MSYISAAKTADDLKGKKVGVQIETTSDYAAEKMIESGTDMNLSKFDAMLDAFTALEGKTIDYILTDKPRLNSSHTKSTMTAKMMTEGRKCILFFFVSIKIPSFHKAARQPIPAIIPMSGSRIATRITPMAMDKSETSAAAYQAAGSSLLGRGYAVGGAVRPVFQRRQVLIGSFAHASLRFLWRVLFPRCLSIDELSQVYTFLTACAVYPRGRKSA